eukprot:scaffold260689_cov40-Tisochrysis_lutea.AAC.2
MEKGAGNMVYSCQPVHVLPILRIVQPSRSLHDIFCQTGSILPQRSISSVLGILPALERPFGKRSSSRSHAGKPFPAQASSSAPPPGCPVPSPNLS